MRSWRASKSRRPLRAMTSSPSSTQCAGASAIIGLGMKTLSHIAALQARFGIAGVATVVAGKGGLPMVRLSTPLAAADISLYGAQITQWKPADSAEVLFLSEKSYWQ